MSTHEQEEKYIQMLDAINRLLEPSTKKNIEGGSLTDKEKALQHLGDLFFQATHDVNQETHPLLSCEQVHFDSLDKAIKHINTTEKALEHKVFGIFPDGMAETYSPMLNKVKQYARDFESCMQRSGDKLKE